LQYLSANTFSIGNLPILACKYIGKSQSRKKENKMINILKGKYAHVGWVDLENKGIMTECAIMKNNPQSGLFFIKLNNLDIIDKQRLLRIVVNRNAHLYELWDLMSNITLGNGANALDYFHQYVRCLTPSGEIISPNEGRRGFAGTVTLSKNEHQQQAETVQRKVVKKKMVPSAESQ
jgi:hypothetical protein